MWAKEQLHRDLLQLQLNLGWGGDVSDAEAYITQATEKASLNPFQRKLWRARKNAVTPQKSLTGPSKDLALRAKKRKRGDPDPDALDTLDRDVDLDGHGDDLDDRRSKRRSSKDA
jgi:hypothetical protein